MIRNQTMEILGWMAAIAIVAAIAWLQRVQAGL